MSTILADNIGDQLAAKTVPINSITEGTAKAQWRVNQVSPSIQTSNNVTTITDDSTGIHTVQFTNVYTSADIIQSSGHFCFSTDIITSAFDYRPIGRDDGITTSSIEMVTLFTSSTTTNINDYHYIAGQTYGDLA